VYDVHIGLYLNSSFGRSTGGDMERGALGRLLRTRRVTLELTVREIAYRLGMSPMTVSNLERGERVPTEDAALVAIARAYDLDFGAVHSAAIESQAAAGAIELPTDESSPTGAETALALARTWRALTDEDMAAIRSITAKRDGGTDDAR